MTATAFAGRLQRRAAVIEKAIDYLLPPEDAFPDLIHRAMRYSALGGGKRLRGILVLEAAALGGGDPDVAPSPSKAVRDATDAQAVDMPSVIRAIGAASAAGAAIEMIHAYSLVHDDLPCMDDDDLRRGRPTNHRVFGEGIAVLAGDALLTYAFDVLSQLPTAGVSIGAGLQVIASVARSAGTGGLIGGQTADLEAERASDASSDSAVRTADREKQLTAIHTRKTGALIRCALNVGAILGGLDAEQLKAVDEYGRDVGLAFQIVDDLLDLTGDEELLGKTTGSDERRGKLTFPSIYGTARSESMAHEHIQSAKQSLAPFGRRADFLCHLADYVGRRDH